MASWKKVIVSGSAAELLNVTASAGISAATIKDVTSFTAAADLDIGAHGFRVESLTADGLTSGRVVFAGANGLLSDDGDMTFATDTLTVTKLGAFEAAGAIDFSDEEMTNVDIDSGTIDGTDVTVGSGKTLDVSAGTLTTSAAQKKAIVEGVGADTDIGAYELRAATFESDIATGTAPFTVASTTEVANLKAATAGTAATVTSATQASITTTANLVTVGALDAGSITSGFT